MNLLVFFAKKDRADHVIRNLFYVRGLKNQNTNKRQKTKTYTHNKKLIFKNVINSVKIMSFLLKHVTLSKMLDD